MNQQLDEEEILKLLKKRKKRLEELDGDFPVHEEYTQEKPIKK